MAFPTSPTNGQQANINGITYTYSSAATAWTVSTSVSNTFVSINVSDNVNSGNVLATGVISATGNVSGGNLVVTGNIIDTGALTIVTGSNGNITLSPNGTGIVAATGAISTTGNISANNATFTSNQTLSYGTANGVVYLNSNKVATSGTALVFDGTNLGVGVTPSVKLDIVGTASQITNGAGASGSRIRLDTPASSGGSYIQIYKDLTPSYVAGIGTVVPGGSAASALVFSDYQGSWVERARMDSSGNFGVGTTTPASFGAICTRRGISVAGVTGSVSASFSDGANDTLYISQDSSLSRLTFAALTFNNGTTERARFSSDGVFQVGRTGGSAPDGKLQVIASGTGAGTANTKLGFALIEDDSGNAAGLWLGSMTNQNTGVIGSRTASGNIAFQTYNGGWGERVRITYDGNLLVGTTSTYNSAKLSVAGEVEFRGNTRSYGASRAGLAIGASVNLFTIPAGSYGTGVSMIVYVQQRDDNIGALSNYQYSITGWGGSGVTVNVASTQGYGASSALTVTTGAVSGSAFVTLTNSSGRASTSLQMSAIVLIGYEALTWGW